MIIEIITSDFDYEDEDETKITKLFKDYHIYIYDKYNIDIMDKKFYNDTIT